MEDKDIVKIFLDTQEWQTFECMGLFSRWVDNKTDRGISPF
ncbi:MAG: hypothetical protein AAB404_00580 [Patescibacteria group bacterium]